MRPRTLLAALSVAIVLAAAVSIATPAQAQNITLNGAVQFNDDHAFTKALVRFEELVKKYYGKPISITSAFFATSSATGASTSASNTLFQ